MQQLSEDGAALAPEELDDPAALARALISTRFPGFVGQIGEPGAQARSRAGLGLRVSLNPQP